LWEGEGGENNGINHGAPRPRYIEPGRTRKRARCAYLLRQLNPVFFACLSSGRVGRSFRVTWRRCGRWMLEIGRLWWCRAVDVRWGLAAPPAFAERAPDAVRLIGSWPTWAINYSRGSHLENMVRKDRMEPSALPEITCRAMAVGVLLFFSPCCFTNRNKVYLWL
jgi:hypothetical protein